MSTFSEFPFLPTIQKTLKEKRFSKPTEVQNRAIPTLLNGKSLVGVSETGSGKTLSYALPMLHLLKTLEEEGQAVTESGQPRAIVMVPTRELGEQVAKVFKEFTHDTRLRVRTVLGGTTFEQARRNISGPFEILLATPGRLVQLMDRNLIQLSDVRLLVFDEADQMLDSGFLPDSELVAAACPEDVQLALFSATVSPAVQKLIDSLFNTAEEIRSSGSGKVVKSLITQNRIVKDGKRWPLLESILEKPVEGGTLIFTNTREQCDKLAKELSDNGYSCAIYRGEMDKNERRANLKKFRSGEVELLVSTELGARGLDIDHVGRVINYHLPKQMENYIHRAGRTARAGREGVVINLVTERDERLIAQLEGRKLPTRSFSKDRKGSESRPGKFSSSSKEKPTSKQFSKSNSKPGAKPSVKANTKSGAKTDSNSGGFAKKSTSPRRFKKK